MTNKQRITQIIKSKFTDEEKIIRLVSIYEIAQLEIDLLRTRVEALELRGERE